MRSACVGHVIGMFLLWFGHVLACYDYVLRACIWHVFDMWWYVSHMCRTCVGHVLGISWTNYYLFLQRVELILGHMLDLRRACTGVCYGHVLVTCFAFWRYDSIVSQTDVVENTLSPVWNRTFYFPVRVIDDSIRTNADYYKTTNTNCFGKSAVTKS